MPGETLLTLPYGGVSPRFAGAPLHAGPGAAVLGRVTVGTGGWFGAGSLVRADGHYVTLGDNFRLGARGTVHIAHEVYPTHVGSNVTAGEGAVIHACDMGDGCHVGAGAIILDGAQVAAGTAIAPGSVVFPRATLDGGWLYAGAPAEKVRRLEPGELDALHAATRAEPDLRGTPGPAPALPEGFLFAAANARLTGRVTGAGGVGVWYGCVLEAAAGRAIRIGENTNIQDNSILRAEAADLSIGAHSSVGHNVTMTDCTVGDRSLIGIGAVVAAGTVVEGDVLLAAGSETEPGQVLESGWLWGGRPARRIRPLDGPRRGIIEAIWPTYCDYARAFQAAQEAAAAAV